MIKQKINKTNNKNSLNHAKNPKLNSKSKLRLEWQEPLSLASKISQNYQDNWVFLYSALNKINKNSKSYIALFENYGYRGNNFDDFQKILQKNNSFSKNLEKQKFFGEKWFGGICYEVADQFENFTKTTDSPIIINQIFFSKFDLVLEFNHKTKELLAFCNDSKLINILLNYKFLAPSKNIPTIENISSNFNDESYKEEIEKLKKMIADGDFFQANLTRKFFGKFTKTLSPIQNFQIFLNLMEHSPGNYSSFMKFEDNFIISSSPELFLKSRNRQIISRPIKGSIHRGKNSKEDYNNKNYLKNSCKEKAENLMIVDLIRNDFSRFCSPASVLVTKLFTLSTYKTIHHLSSQIEGKMADNISIFDAIKACFPPGSMTGAPKIKVIEVLKNIEKLNRGIYSGALGYVSENAVNLAVVIRTLITNKADFEFQVGGGITFDSNPELELKETYSKMRGILESLDLTAISLKK